MPALAQELARPKPGLVRGAVDIGIIVAGSLLVAGLAQVSVRLPFTPVPITGQTLGVLLVGTSLGWLRGGLSLALYLVEGSLLGLPFFAGGSSGVQLVSLSSATGGYLWGFVVAASFAGWLANRGWDRRLRSSIGVMLLANVVIYLTGVPWLMLALDIPLSRALELGLYPFVVGDIVKLLVAAGLVPPAWRIVKRVDGRVEES
jgi:biotin transport system substrate-specific component